MDEQAEAAARCRGIEKVYRRATGETSAVVSAPRMQRRADRANVAELMRVV
jgi:hypothetical protein